MELTGVGIDSSLQMKGEPLSCYGLTTGGKLVKRPRRAPRKQGTRQVNSTALPREHVGPGLIRAWPRISASHPHSRWDLSYTIFLGIDGNQLDLVSSVERTLPFISDINRDVQKVQNVRNFRE